MLTKVSELGSLTSVHLEWSSVDAAPPPGGDVLGYQLKVFDSYTGESWIAFDGQEFG